MKKYDDIRQKTSPHKAAVIGWAGFFVPLFLAGVVMMGAGGDRRTSAIALTIGLIIAALFMVFWCIFGRCYECGHMPRPFEEYCSQCGASLNKLPAQNAAEADAQNAASGSAVSGPAAPGSYGIIDAAPENVRDLTETQLSSEEVFDGKVLHVFRDQISLPDGRTAERELMRHVGAVCIVPVTEDRNVVVERQYRYPVAQPVIEIPAGKLDYPGEDRLEAAKRELREETGYTADRWTDIGLYYGAPAFCDEKITIYLAEGLHRGEQELDEDEFLEVYEIPLHKLVKMVVAGEIVDGKTQVAILKASAILNARL